ncbi:hypothetical protein DRP05_14135 [Archaeoglobales archaeon]|nr:MAG: hypothetical protein DRP05_14135 [Archaeoglobales archaeon]
MPSASEITIDLLTPEEEEAVRVLQELILAKTAEARKRAVQVLAVHNSKLLSRSRESYRPAKTPDTASFYRSSGIRCSHQ